MDRDPTTRRGVLGGVAAGLVAIAGCTGDGGGDAGGGDDGGGDETTTATTTTTTTTTTNADAGGGDGDEGTTTGETATTTTMTTDDLDLREANVTGVTFERGDGDYRFSVELYHDDDGEEGYANWWQVERPGGEQLGRRELLHAHGTRKFTRSETVSIPDDVRRVVVRGHDQTHGYGGQAAIVDLESGDVEYVRQGPEPQDFSGRA